MAEEENEVKQINDKDENKMEDSTNLDKLEDKSSAESKSDSKDENEAKLEKVEDKSDDEENDDDEEEDEEDDDDEGETLPPGLLEQPLEVEGKRQKKKVERLSATMMRSPAEKTQIEIEEGLGTKLGDIPYVAHYLNITKAADLKSLHKLLFFRAGTLNEIKKNIRKFSGVTEAKDSKDREKRLVIANKMSLTELKTLSLWMGLKQGGTKSDLIGRAMEFFEKPKDQGLEVKKKRKPKSEQKTGKKRKRKTKKTNKEDKSKKKVKKTKKAKVEEEEEEDEEDGEEQEEEEMEEDEASEDDGDVDEEDSEEEAPKKKKPKLEVKKKEKKTPKKAVKENGKEKGTPKKEKQTPKKKAAPAKKETKKKATPKKETAELSDSLSEDSDSEEEPLVKSVKPPSNDEIKRVVKDILDGADLETVTMKTVVKQVYAKYPKFDLSDRKDFIKNTVREVIS